MSEGRAELACALVGLCRSVHAVPTGPSARREVLQRCLGRLLPGSAYGDGDG